VLTDPNGITLPGLTVTIEIVAPIVVPACLYLFTIFKLHEGRRHRVYQLEVCPDEKVSHRDPMQVLYGPHEHFGEEAQKPPTEALTCGDWKAAYLWFCERCNLEPYNLEPP
jgi:hypothetical protein